MPNKKAFFKGLQTFVLTAVFAAVAPWAHAAYDWTAFATVSPTSTLSAGHLCYTDGTDIACPSTSPYFNTTTGNVGIGTTTPSVTLSIIGKNNGNDGIGYRQLMIGNDNPSSQFLFLGTASGIDPYIGFNTFYYTSYQYKSTSTSGAGIKFSSGRIDFYNNTGLTKDTAYTPTVRMTIGVGTVGISTTNPSTTLHVNGTLRLADGGEACDTNRAGAIKFTGSTFYVCDGTSGWQSLSAAAASGGVDRITSNTTGITANGTSTYISITNAGTTTGYFDSTGRLITPGISVTTNQLSVTSLYASDVATLGRVVKTGVGATTNDSAIEIGNNRTGDGNVYTDFHATSGSDYDFRIIRRGGADGSAELTNAGTGPLIVNNPSGTEFMRVTNVGRVGIGTTSPQTSLQISGTIRIADGGEACDTNRTGAIKYTTGTFYFCGTSGWQSFTSMASATTLDLYNLTHVSGSTTGGNIFVGDATGAISGIVTQTTSLGIGALGSGNNTGFRNVAIGKDALYNNTSGTYNNAFGYRSLFSNTTGYNNTAGGQSSLYYNSTGIYNTALGSASLLNNTSGSNNTALGSNALYNNTTGNSSAAIGYAALYNNTTGSYNTAIGLQSQYFADPVSYTVAMGYRSAYGVSGSTAYQSGVYIGAFSGFGVTTGNSNVAIGYNALYEGSSGAANTVLGYNTGRGITTGSNNTILGANVTGLAADLSNTVILADGSGNKRLYIDNAGNIGIGTLYPSSTLHIVSNSWSTLTLGRLGDPDTGFMKFYGNTTSGMIVGTTGSNPLRLSTNNSERLRIAASGQVGISTTSPQTTLHVNGTLRLADGGETCDTNRAGAIKFSGSTFYVCDGTSGWQSLSAAAASGGVDRIISSTTGITANGTSTYISITNAGTTTGYFDTTGRLITPGISLTTNQLSATTASFYNTATFEGASGVGNIRVRGAGGTWFWIDNPSINTLRFSSGATPGTNPMVLDTSGNVGIGTTTPSYTLTTSGTLQVKNQSTASILHTNQEIYSQNTPLYLNYNSTSNTIINGAGGSVGIGTISPNSTLHVNGGITQSGSNTWFVIQNSADTSNGGSSRQWGINIAGASWPYSAGTFAIKDFVANAERLVISTSGNVGIGTTSPAVSLTVVGDIRTGTATTNGCVENYAGTAIAGTCSSDARLKTNIKALDGDTVLTRLTHIQPSSFEWRVKDYPQFHFGPGKQLGLIAQQVEETFPELVETAKDGFKKVKYSDLPIYTLQAVKELKAENDTLKAQNTEILKQLQSLQQQVKALQQAHH